MSHVLPTLQGSGQVSSALRNLAPGQAELRLLRLRQHHVPTAHASPVHAATRPRSFCLSLPGSPGIPPRPTSASASRLGASPVLLLYVNFPIVPFLSWRPNSLVSISRQVMLLMIRSCTILCTGEINICHLTCWLESKSVRHERTMEIVTKITFAESTVENV